MERGTVRTAPSSRQNRPILTLFAKKNNGVFPLSAVYDAIDGRNAVASHGIREHADLGVSTQTLAHFANETRKSEGKSKVYRPPDRYEFTS